MVNPIPEFLKNTWSNWNIRIVILTSLCLQITLIFLAPFRKRTRKRTLAILLWSTYLLADYTANFCIGLISNKYGDKDTNIYNINDFVLTLWAPFLLLHLGGPDTITAFSLEDNELWLRHMLGLMVQLCLTSYVFILTLPENTLWIPTVLVFMSGIIKYAERTRSLQLASIDNFRQSMTPVPDPGPNYAELMEEYKSRKDAGIHTEIVSKPEVAEQGLITPKVGPDVDADADADATNKGKNNDIEKQSSEVADSDSASKHEQEKLDDVDVVRDAYHHFNTFKGLIVDMIFSFHERNESRKYFLSQTAVDALRVIEVELNFMYEAFYTKASVVRDKVGYLFRFVGVCSIVAALVLFVLDQKHGCDKFDIMVTYTLFYGAVALDLVSLLMLIFSDHTYASFAHPQRNYCTRGIGKFAISVFKTYLKLKRPTWQEKPKRKGKILSTRTLSRRWSGSISEFNLMSYILNKRGSWVDKVIDYIGATELVEQWRYEKKKPLLQDLWIFIFKELERKSGDAADVKTIQRICSSRGAWVIQEGQVLRDDINRLMPYVDANTVTFDQSLILWHIATDLLFYEDVEIDDETGEDVELQRNFSKLLSDYMLYLLIMQPTMMSAVRGIGQIRFQDTCAEAIRFFEKRGIMAEKEKGNDAFSKNFWNRLIDLGKKKFHKSTRKIEKNIEHQKEACSKLSGVRTEKEPSSVKGDRSKSVLFDGCRLAYQLKILKEKKKKWKIMAQVWVELLSYAACSCRPITHVQQLSKGGEFMSLVWLLMTHLGLAKQFQITGHARAELVTPSTRGPSWYPFPGMRRGARAELVTPSSRGPSWYPFPGMRRGGGDWPPFPVPQSPRRGKYSPHPQSPPPQGSPWGPLTHH